MELTLQQKELLDDYLCAIIEANTTTNLTRIDNTESGRLLHIEDSLAGLPEFLEAPGGLYADLGTGGGFPGVPLSVVTGREVLLVDSVKKKIAVLESIVEQLGLSRQITTYAGRIEELALDHRDAFSVLTARALTSLPSLLELASPLLVTGGRLISYKAAHPEEEVDQSVALEQKLGMRMVGSRGFVLSDGKTARSIIVFEKVHEPEVNLPRRPGMAQKRPYRV